MKEKLLEMETYLPTFQEESKSDFPYSNDMVLALALALAVRELECDVDTSEWYKADFVFITRGLARREYTSPALKFKFL